MSGTNRTDIANHLWRNTLMFFTLLLLGILLITQPTYAEQHKVQTDWQVIPALPPLVEQGEAVKDLPEWMIEQRTRYNAVAYSPDGRTLASASHDKTIKLWDIESRRLIHIFQGHTSSVNSVAFSPDGRSLASASHDKTIKLWDIANQGLIHTFQGHSNDVNSVAFSPDGRSLASASDDNTIKLWDIANQRLIHTFQGHTDQVNSVAFSPDGRALASASSDNTIKLWDIANQGLIHTFQGHSSDVSSVAFSPDGRSLASASDDNTIKLWDIANQGLIHTFQGHTDQVNSVAFSLDGRTLASASVDVFSSDNTIKLWDIANKGLIHTFQGNTNLVQSVAFSPNGRTIASASYDDTIKLWDIANQSLIHTFRGHSNNVDSVAFSPDGRTLTSISSDKSVKLWDIPTQRLISTLKGHITPIDSVFSSLSRYIFSINSTAFSPDGRIFASGEVSNLKLWDTPNQRLIHTFQGHSSVVWSVAFSPDGRTLASASWDNTIKLWDIAKQRLIHTFQGHTDQVRSVAFSPDGHTLASASWDNTVKLWDIANRRLIHTFQGHTDWVTSVAFSPDGRTLASASRDNTIKLWNIANRRLIHTFQGHTDWVASVAFSPDGRTLASASADNTVKIWDIANQRLIDTLEGHSSSVLSVAYSPDGRTLASASSSSDGTIKLWDIEQKQLLYTLTGGAEGNWLVQKEDADNKTIWRSDDGSLLLNSNNFAAVLPASAVNGGNLILETKTPLKIDSGRAAQLNLTLKNPADSATQYFITAQAENAEHYTINTLRIPKLAPGEEREISLSVSANLTNLGADLAKQHYYPKPINEPLKLTFRSANGVSVTQDIPVEVHYPDLQWQQAEVLQNDDSRTLVLDVANNGQQLLKEAFIQLALPGFKSDPIPFNQIEPSGIKKASFVLPDGYELDKTTQANVKIWMPNLPAYEWQFNNQSIILPRPAWQLYVALVLMLLALASVAFYLSRYRHALVLALRDQQALFGLSADQLAEARLRLRKVNRLADVLSATSVSRATLDKSIDFFQTFSAQQRAEHFALRVAADCAAVTEQHGLAVFELTLGESFPLNLPSFWLVLLEPDLAAQDALQHVKTLPQYLTRTLVLIGQDAEVQRELLRATSDQTNRLVAPSSVELTRLLLAPNAEQVLAEVLSGQLALQNLSPYQVGGGVMREPMFFGRMALISHVMNRDPANYLIVGGRQLGKSSFMKALQRRYVEQGAYQCVYFSVGEEDLMAQLADELALEPDQANDMQAFVQSLQTYVRQQSRPVIVMIDEADKFIRHERQQDYRLLNRLRRLSEQGQCSFMLAGFWDLYEHAVLDYQSPLKNFGEVLRIDALEKDACHQLATEPMRAMRIAYASDALVDKLIEATGQRANLLSVACQHLLVKLPPGQREINAGDVQRALDSKPMQERMAGWHSAKMDRLVVFASITMERFSYADVLQRLQDAGAQVDPHALDLSLQRLELGFVLGKVNKHYFYRVPLFRQMVLADDPQMRLQAELSL